MRSTKINFDIFIEIMFTFLLHLLIENFKPETIVSKETMGLVVGMATILSYIIPRSTARITIIGYSSPWHFS